jgi:hypothetical protein
MNQYIASLNPLPGSTEPTPTEGSFPNLDDELSLFTNVEFLNEFDLGDTVEGQGVNGSEDGTSWSMVDVRRVAIAVSRTLRDASVEPMPLVLARLLRTTITLQMTNAPQASTSTTFPPT